MNKCFQPRNALTPAFSHRMGEGESHPVFLAVVSAGFAGQSFLKQKTTACCSLSRRTGEGQGEGFL